MTKQKVRQILNRLKKWRNLMYNEDFRRIVYPESVGVCFHDCNAGDDCCHQFEVEGALFCIDFGTSQYDGGKDYICEKKINGKWTEVDKEIEVKETGCRIGWW